MAGVITAHTLISALQHNYEVTQSTMIEESTIPPVPDTTIPPSIGLLGGGGGGLHSLSRDQAMDAAIQLHRDVCLMTSDLDVLISMPSRCRARRLRFWNWDLIPGVFPRRR